MLLSTGGHGAKTISYDIQYAFIPDTPHFDITSTQCHTFIGGQKQDEICWTFGIDLTSHRVYYGVGLGHNILYNTYAFVVFNDTQIYERRLDYWLPGYFINPKSITIIS
eukprot:239244_1